MESEKNHPQIVALLHGDKTIIGLLYQKLFPKVIIYVRNNSKGTQEDAEEVFHNALFQLITRAKVGGVQINSSFEAYVFTVCKNLWLKELSNRKKVVRNDSVFELKANEDMDLVSIIQQERWELFEETLLKLTKNCSELLKAYFKKVPYNEIIKKFSYSSENTAFQRIFKCKKKLAELIKVDSRYKNLYL